MINLVRNTSVKTKGNVLAAELKEMACSEGQSSRGGAIEIQSGSKSLPVKIGKERCKPRAPVFSHDNMKRLGAQLNLSDNSIM